MKLNIENLTKKLGENIIIDNVNLSLKSGMIYGLCGYNGCGKTMLMRLVSGLIMPTSGTISFDDKILGKDIDFPPDIGILIENPAFLGGYSGLENLKMIASIKGKIAKNEIEKTLKRVGLDDANNKKYSKYSLGMKQRLGIAAAIMESPSLIILDEPTNALDSKGVEQVKKIIKEERERGALIIMTCHDRSILDDLCDEIFQIDLGKIVN